MYLQECGQLGVVAIITKWLDLGAGRAMMDPKWWSHLSVSYTSNHLFAGAGFVYQKRLTKRVAVPFEASSIQASFEQNEHLVFDPIQTSEIVNECSNAELSLVPIRSTTAHALFKRAGLRLKNTLA